MAVRREPLSRRRPRGFFTVQMTGAQSAALVIPITETQFFDYDSDAKVDPGKDISRFYRCFAIQPEDTGTASESENVQVQINLVGGDNNWVAPSPAFTSDLEAEASPGLLTPGTLFFMELPAPGISVRLLVTTPDAGTDYKVTVLMTNSSERRSLDNA